MVEALRFLSSYLCGKATKRAVPPVLRLASSPQRIGRTPHNLETLIEKKFLQLEGDQGFIFDNQHAHRLKLFCPGRAKGIPSEAFRAPGITRHLRHLVLSKFRYPSRGTCV
jgi:hypothetical protein